MTRSVFLGVVYSCILTLTCASASGQVINELGINPPATDNPCEFIELRGTPGAVIENVYFVAFEGDGSSNPGVADTVVTFAAPGVAFGSNGLIVLTGTQACGSRTYPPETTRLQAAFLDTGTSGLENGAISFLLISSPVAIALSTDYDTDNNGTLEGLPSGAVILDSVAWTDGDANDITYGSVVLSTTGNIGAATRFPGDTRPNTPAAWYAGAIGGTTNDSTVYGTPRTTNFPSNGALTPGATNVGGGATPDAPVDINGDSRSDYVVVRPAGGVGSNLTWHHFIDDGNPTYTREWGISGDQVLMGDYDGDGRDDVTVFRPSNGTFYIIQSNTLTMRTEQFGQSGDNARVVGDYNGDGRDDLALYRPGSPSVWYYKTSPTNLFVSVEWGEATDTPAPGDYDGDGRADFVVRRANGADGVFWKRLATGVISNETFGLATDLVVPGDYDDDGKTDVSVVRATASPYTWLFEPSGTAGSTVVSDTWGVPGDVITPGDYDGDGRSDYAIWRPGSPGVFWVMTVADRVITIQAWGQTGDYPVANYNVFQ